MGLAVNGLEAVYFLFANLGGYCNDYWMQNPSPGPSERSDRALRAQNQAFWQRILPLTGLKRSNTANAHLPDNQAV